MSGSRQGRRVNTLVAAVCAVTLAAGVAACGAASDPGAVTASVFVTSVCKAVGPFEHEIAASSATLTPAPTSSPAQRKAMVEGFLRTIAADAHAAAAALSAAHHPDVKQGRAIARTFVAIFTRIEGSMHAAATTASTLPTGSAGAFRRADTRLGNFVRSSITNDLGSGLQVLRNRALETAAVRAPACHALS